MPSAWIKFDANAPRPEWSDIQRSHTELSFRPVNIDHPAASAVLEELQRTHIHGDALLKQFVFDADDEVLQWFASRNRFAECGFFQAALATTAVCGALPELKVPRSLARDLGFEESWTGTLTLDGELAATLVLGGAYERFKGTPTEAKQLCGRFVDAVVGDRHAEFKVYRSDEPWTPWFAGIAWDHTWCLIDRGQNQITLLCLTDWS